MKNQELRQILHVELQRFYSLPHTPEPLTCFHIELDEDNSSFYTTPNECRAFAIDKQHLKALTFGYMAYEFIAGICDILPTDTSPRLRELLTQYRSQLEGFQLEPTIFDDDHFIQFMQEFFDVPWRSSYGYTLKRYHNIRHLIVRLDDDLED